MIHYPSHGLSLENHFSQTQFQSHERCAENRPWNATGMRIRSPRLDRSKYWHISFECIARVVVFRLQKIVFFVSLFFARDFLFSSSQNSSISCAQLIAMTIETISTDRTFECRSVDVNRPDSRIERCWTKNEMKTLCWWKREGKTLCWCSSSLSHWNGNEKVFARKNAILFFGSMVYYCKFCSSSLSQMIHKSYTRSIDIE